MGRRYSQYAEAPSLMGKSIDEAYALASAAMAAARNAQTLVGTVNSTLASLDSSSWAALESSLTALRAAVADLAGWAEFSDGYVESLPTGNPLPTSVTAYLDSGKTVKVWEKLITYTDSLETTVVLKIYSSGVLVRTYTTTLTYSGAVESSRSTVES